MFMPFGQIDGKVLTIGFSSADFSVASVLAALREHLDLLNEMKIEFAGIATDVTAGDPKVFKPVMITRASSTPGTATERPISSARTTSSGRASSLPSRTKRTGRRARSLTPRSSGARRI